MILRNISELSKELSDRCGIDPRDSRIIVEVFFNIIEEHLIIDRNVTLGDMGELHVSNMKPCVRRNSIAAVNGKYVRVKEEITTNPIPNVKFKAFKGLRKRLMPDELEDGEEYEEL